MLCNHIEIEVSYLVVCLFAFKGIEYSGHSFLQRTHDVYLEHLGRIAHRALHDVLKNVWIFRRSNILNLLIRNNGIHQLLQGKHIVHETLCGHVAVLIQRTVVSVKGSSCGWGSTEMNLSVCSLLIICLW